MNIHKLLTGSGAGTYLPFALSRIRYLAKAFGFPITQNYQVGDTNISVSTNPGTGQHRLRIDGDSGFYEFFTPDTVTGITGVTVGCVTAINSIKGAAKAIASETIIGQGIRNPATPLTPTLCRTWAAHNTGHTPEHIHWTLDAKGLVKGWTASTNIGPGMIQPWRFDYGFYDILTRCNDDVGLDLMPRYHVSGGGEGPRKAPDSFDPLIDQGHLAEGTPIVSRLYYGRACVQRVSHPEFGARAFYVMTDSHNAFYVYPVADDGSDVQVSNMYAMKTSTNFVKCDAPLPAWAMAANDSTQVANLGTVAASDLTGDAEYVLGRRLYTKIECSPTASDAPKLDNRYRYKWTFNSSGTKATAVVAATPTPDVLGTQRFVGFSSGIVSLGPTYDPPGWEKTPRVESFPGVVEVAINIVLTGPGLGEFTASVDLLREFKAIETGKYYCAADYAFGDKRLLDMGINLDDLVVASMRMDLWTETTPDAPSGYRNYIELGVVGQAPALTVLARTFNLYTLGSEYVKLVSPGGAAIGYAELPVEDEVVSIPPSGGKRFDGAQVDSLSLRTMSMIVTLIRDLWPWSAATPGQNLYHHGSCVVSYGKIVEIADGFVAEDFLNVPTVATPVSLASRFGSYARATVLAGLSDKLYGLYASGMISDHPNGNIAFYRRPAFETRVGVDFGYVGILETVVDRIEWVRKDRSGAVVSTEVRTHKDAFNEAFGLVAPARDYSFYEPGGAGDQAGFCSWGVWSSSQVRYNLPKTWEKPTV